MEIYKQKKKMAAPLRKEDFQNKYVFIGVSAVGGADLKTTSIGELTPGVFLQASTLSNVLNKDFLKNLAHPITISITWILALLCASFIIHSLSFIFQIPFLIFTILIIPAVSFYALESQRYVIPIVYPVLTLLMTILCSYLYMTLTEGREKRKTRKMLAQYVSPHVLEQVMDKKDMLKAEVGTKEHMTILFSDVRSFTSFSEKHPPEKVVEMLNYYLNHMVDVVFHHQGTLDKFVGDAVMAFWGAPLKTSTHAFQAVSAGRDMLSALRKVNQYFQSKQFPLFEIGVGVHTGDVILGNIGSEKKLDYTVIGDNVNLASRIEGLTKTYHSELLISESTYVAVKDNIPCKIMDYVRVKGKEKPIGFYAPLLHTEERSKEKIETDMVAMYEEAFHFYLQKNFSKALMIYTEAKKYEPYTLHLDYLSMMIERCQNFQAQPPEDQWDGVYTMTSK
jgi:adenylate cyclase